MVRVVGLETGGEGVGEGLSSLGGPLKRDEGRGDQLPVVDKGESGD